MPRLRSMTCAIHWGESSTVFQEYGTCYGDGVVETHIVVPHHPQHFTIRVTSKGFISEGLAVVVFMDGHYQTNRIRLDLQPARKGLPQQRTELDLTLRQKEKPLGDGMYMGRAWRFDKHNTIPNLPQCVTNNHFDELGTIEVIILRCSANESDETNESTTSSAAQSDIVGALDRNEDDQTVVGQVADAKQSKKNKSKEKKPKADKPKEDNLEEDEVEKVPPKGDLPKKKKSKKGKPKPEQEPEGPTAEVLREDVEADDDFPILSSMPGMFDGPSDYSSPRQTYGNWDWQGRPPDHLEKHSYGYHPSGPPNGYGTSRPYYPAYNTNFLDSTAPPPPEGRRTQSEKKVHFDYGQDHGPAADHARYTDSHGGSAAYPREDHRSRDDYYSAGMSDGYVNHPGRYPERSGYEHSYRPYETERERYGHHSGQQDMPPPWHHPYPPYTPHQPPAWTGSHPHHLPAPQMYGMPHGPPPGYCHPYAPFYAPSGGMPPAPHTGDDKNGNNQNDNETQKPGSLDPAKDDNNKDDRWGPTSNSNVNDSDTFGKNDDFQTNNNSNDNDNQNDEPWGSGNDNNQSNNTVWNDDTPDQDNTNNTSWNDNAGKQGDGSGWENNDVSTPTGDGGGWDDSRKSSMASQTSGPGGHQLFGPHGAYYATQFSTAVEADYDAEEEPKYDVPQAYISRTGSSQQVQPGKGYLYFKKRSHPDYIDNLEEPYARFVFKYRTKEQLQKELSINLETEPSGNPEVQTLQSMGKDELIKMLVRAKGALGGKIPSPPPEVADSATSAVKNVPVHPPLQDFLRYDIPVRAGGSQVGTKGGHATGKGDNNDWSASIDNTNNANTSWNTTDNDTGHAGNSDWNTGAGDWGNTNNATGATNNWNSGGEDWNNTGGDTNNTTGGGGWNTQEAKDAAKQQQQSGQPPEPPQPRGGW